MRSMRKLYLVGLTVMLAACSSKGPDSQVLSDDFKYVGQRGGDHVYHVSISKALNSPEAKDVLDSGVALRFASGSGRVVQKGLVSNKKTNAVNKTAEEACQWAFLSAVKQFQETARKHNANKAVNLISYYKKEPFSSPRYFECRVGSLMAGVALSGDVAR